jgi:hypothetical protein
MPWLAGLQRQNCDQGRRSLPTNSSKFIRLKTGDAISINDRFLAFHKKRPWANKWNQRVVLTALPEQGIVYNLGMAGLSVEFCSSVPLPV